MSVLDEPLTRRQSYLEQLLREHLHPCLQLIEQTAEISVAQDWLALLGMIEGVVAKRVDSRYEPGRRRDWVKIKRYRTADCVVIGNAGDLRRPKLVLGLRHEDGNLHHFSVTRPIDREARGPLAALLASAGSVEAAIESRWQHDAVPPWRRVEPRVVCEVRVTKLDLGRWARFPVAFVRWRPDRSVDDCTS